MFGLFEQKTKMSPEEFGMMLAMVLSTQWPSRITKHASELGEQVTNVTQSELNDIWYLFFILHCIVVSAEVESSSIDEDNVRIILDAFWNTIPDALHEKGLTKESIVFQSETEKWYEILREMVLEPDAVLSSPGSLGPGKILFQLVMQSRDMRENIDLIDELTGYFASTVVALSEFTKKSISKTKFLPSLIAYE